MWFKKKNEDPLVAEMRKKSTTELKAIVAKVNQEQTNWFVAQFVVMSEMKRRIHEIKFHGREGGEAEVLALEQGISARYKNIGDWLMAEVFKTPNE